jgi:hypothetical protein
MLGPFFLFHPGIIPICIPIVTTVIMIRIVIITTGFVTPERMGYDSTTTTTTGMGMMR